MQPRSVLAFLFLTLAVVGGAACTSPGEPDSIADVPSPSAPTIATPESAVTEQATQHATQQISINRAVRPTPAPRHQAAPTPTPISRPAVDSSPVMGSNGRCTAELPGTLIGATRTLTFDVPDGMKTSDCYGFTFEDQSDTTCCPPLTVRVERRRLNAFIESTTQWAGATLDDVQTTANNQRAAWLGTVQFADDSSGPPRTERKLAVDLENFVLVVTASSQQGVSDQARTWAAFDRLATSMTIDFRQDTGADSWTGSPDRWCVGWTWVIEIPENWLAYHRCDGDSAPQNLNTSDLAHSTMECECLGPLWITHVWPLIERNPDITIVSDATIARADGTPVQVLDVEVNNEHFPELARSVVGSTELRLMIINLGVAKVMIVANPNPHVVAPGHTWQDTLDAQLLLAESLRPWHSPACAARPHRTVQTIESTQLFALPGESTVIEYIPAGTGLRATGCAVDADGTEWVEVQSHSRPDDQESAYPKTPAGGNLVGWVDSTAVAKLVGAECMAVPQTTYMNESLAHALTGDFNGDGRFDSVRLHVDEDPVDTGTDRATLPNTKAVFRFFNGTESVVSFATDFDGRMINLSNLYQARVLRPVGSARDVILLDDPTTPSVFIVGIDDCIPVIHGSVPAGEFCLAHQPFGTEVRELEAAADGVVEPLTDLGPGGEPLCNEQYQPA